MKKIVGQLVLAAATMAFAATAARAEEEGWSYKLTPYLWMMGIDGEIGAGPVTAPVDVDFVDAVKDLQFGGMISAEADYGRWSLLGDLAYLMVETDEDTRVGEFEVELEQWLLQAALAYGVLKTETTTLDLGLGGRYVSLDVDLETPADEPARSQSEGWADPILVARVRQAFTEKFYGVLYGDIGGFGVSSDLTWQVMAAGGYAFNDTVSMLAGYRYLDCDYEKDAFRFDVAESGLVFGLQFSF